MITILAYIISTIHHMYAGDNQVSPLVYLTVVVVSVFIDIVWHTKKKRKQEKLSKTGK